MSILTAWYNKLNGNVSVSVYKVNVPEDETGNYVLLRQEGGTGANDKRTTADEIVIITDVVTVFQNGVDPSVAEGINDAIFSLVLPTPQGNQLTPPSGYQILNLNRENFDCLQESDGVNEYYRIVSRYSHKISKT